MKTIIAAKLTLHGELAVKVETISERLRGLCHVIRDSLQSFPRAAGRKLLKSRVMELLKIVDMIKLLSEDDAS